MPKEKPIYLYTSKEISNLLKTCNPLDNSTATGAAAAWFGQRAYEESVKKAHKTGLYKKAIQDSIITLQQANCILKSFGLK